MNDDFSLRKIFGYGVMILVVIISLSWVFQGNDFFLYKVFAPKQEAVRRQVFEQTPSYTQGKNTYIGRLRAQYESAEGPQKESIRRLILEEAGTIDENNLTSSNRAFVNSLR